MSFAVRIVNVKPKLKTIPQAYQPEQCVIDLLEDLLYRAQNGEFHSIATVTVNHKTKEVGTNFTNVSHPISMLGGVQWLASRLQNDTL